MKSEDSQGLKELYRVLLREGESAEIIEVPSTDGSMSGKLIDINLPKITIDGKWNLNITRIITRWVEEHYKDKQAQREHELKLMKLVVLKESGAKEIVDVEAIEKGELEVPKENSERLSIEMIEVAK